MKRFGIVLILLIISSILFAQAPSWPRWRGANGDGISAETDWNPDALASGAKILWDVNVGFGFSNVVAQDNRVYTCGQIKRVFTCFCLDAVTGAAIWSSKLPITVPWDIAATPALDGERIYGLGGDGTMFCLSIADGALLWKKDLRFDFKAYARTTEEWASSPVVEGALLLLNANSKLLALDKLTGEQVWSIDERVPRDSWGSYSTPVVCDLQGKRVALFEGASRYVAVDVSTGTAMWAYDHPEPDEIITDPVASGSFVYFASHAAAVVLPIASTLSTPVWTNSDSFTTGIATPVAVDGYLYGSHWPDSVSFVSDDWAGMTRHDFPFRCVDFRTGRVVWERTMKNVSVTVAGGKFLLLDVTGTLHIAEATPAGYKELGSADVLAGAKTSRRFASAPVLCAGLIYCRNYAGDLVCIDVSK